MIDLLLWYLITFYESILIPFAILYLLFYLLFHFFLLPIAAFEALLLPFLELGLLVDVLEIAFLTTIAIFLFSTFIIRPFALLPRNVLTQSFKYERILYFIAVVCLVFLVKDHNRITEVQTEMSERFLQMQQDRSQILTENQNLQKTLQDFQQQIAVISYKYDQTQLRLQQLEEFDNLKFAKLRGDLEGQLTSLLRDSQEVKEDLSQKWTTISQEMTSCQDRLQELSQAIRQKQGKEEEEEVIVLDSDRQ